jgi:nitrous oxide reductase accessory protein NosL
MCDNGDNRGGTGHRASRRQFITALACLGGALLLPGTALAVTERPLCPVCRRYIDTSPQACSAHMLLCGKHRKTITVCSVLCLHEKLAEYGSAPEFITVADFSTLEDEYVQQLNVVQAHFVFDAEGDESLSQAPFTYAFRNKDDARELADKRGGEVIGWDELTVRCTELAEEWEREKPQHRHSPNMRGRR